MYASTGLRQNFDAAFVCACFAAGSILRCRHCSVMQNVRFIAFSQRVAGHCSVFLVFFDNSSAVKPAHQLPSLHWDPLRRLSRLNRWRSGFFLTLLLPIRAKWLPLPSSTTCRLKQCFLTKQWFPLGRYTQYASLSHATEA